jgi:hypothetical protein
MLIDFFDSLGQENICIIHSCSMLVHLFLVPPLKLFVVSS